MNFSLCFGSEAHTFEFCPSILDTPCIASYAPERSFNLRYCRPSRNNIGMFSCSIIKLPNFRFHENPFTYTRTVTN